MKHYLDLELSDWQTLLAEWEEPKFRATQIFQWIYKSSAHHPDQMTNLSKSLRAKLVELVQWSLPETLCKLESEDWTTKLLLIGERKQFIPLTFWADGWKAKAPPEPRPLYGLDRLAARPAAPVLLCEGEKASDAAGGLLFSLEHLVIIAATAVLCAVLYAVFRFTTVGIAMQASSQIQLAAYYMGIPVQKLNGLVWARAAAVAAVAGLLLAPITFVHVNMGFIGLKAFPAAVVGGFGSLPGAIVGGLIIGLVESFAGFYLPTGFKDIAPYIVVLVMLWFKPNGLFGEKLRKKV
jgi:ABC-type uncharacterized transport system permease subunit